MREASVTLILTLKGREHFTPRWLRFHAPFAEHFPILIGDGDTKSNVPAFLDLEMKRSGAKNIQYFRYDDANEKKFFLKLHDLATKVKTPYVMYCDNDDFVLSTGVNACVEFLEKNRDYVSCGGAITEFATTTRNGKTYVIDQAVMYGPHSIDASAALERVTILTRTYPRPTWYNVHRTDAICEAQAMACASGITDFQVHEIFLSQITAIAGKHKTLPWPIQYIRQANTSMGSASLKSIEHRIAHSSLVSDSKAAIEIIADRIAKTDGKPKDSIESQIFSAFTDYLARGRAKVKSKLSPKSMTVQKFLSLVKQFLYKLRFHSWFVHRFIRNHEKNRIFFHMQKAGFPADTMMRSRAEYDLFLKTMDD